MVKLFERSLVTTMPAAQFAKIPGAPTTTRSSVGVITRTTRRLPVSNSFLPIPANLSAVLLLTSVSAFSDAFINGGTQYADVAVGKNHACALVRGGANIGMAECWGDPNTFNSVNAPTQLPGSSLKARFGE